MTDPAREAGLRALESLDRALSQQPVRDGHAFSAATESLCRMRDGLSSDEDEASRGAVNAVISAVLAGHFPLGKTPWPEVEAAATILRRLVEPS